MNEYLKINIEQDDFDEIANTGFSYSDSIKFSTLIVLEHIKKGFLPCEFIEKELSLKLSIDTDWGTALYTYSNYLYDLYQTDEMEMN